MLILPPGHEGPRRGLSRRERVLVRGVAAVAALLIVAVVVSLVATGPGTARGCVRATYAGPVGAEQVYECGDAARALCRSLRRPGGFTGDAATSVAAACRKAGLPAS